MDIIGLYRDFGVDFRTEGQKHTRPGWVNVPCPFCTGNPGLHLGWNIEDEYYFCWRCGWHPTIKTVAEVVHVTEDEAENIIQQYGHIKISIKTKKIEKKQFAFPSNTTELKEVHRRYLKKRGFDPDEIIETWKVKATGPLSMLGNSNYRFRILIPYYWNGVPVSFDARDVTGKQKNKYQACPKEYELMEHKRILYGNQEKWDPDLGIIVEGPTDVWAMGEESCAVSGISFTPAQVRLISTIFKRVAIVFDYEPQAQIQASKLEAELKFRGVKAFKVKIDGDPGSRTKKEIITIKNKIKNEIR